MVMWSVGTVSWWTSKIKVEVAPGGSKKLTTLLRPGATLWISYGAPRERKKFSR